MKKGMKGFSRAIREGDAEEAEKMLEKIVQGTLSEEVWKGYHWALKGMIDALNSDDDLSLAHKIAENDLGLEKLRKLKKSMEERASENFRPEYEKGFNKAWRDVFTVIIKDSEEE